MRKKGVSLMVAYVLLITITISLSIIVFAWLRYYVTPGEETSCPEGVLLAIQEYSYDGSELNLTIKNKGRFSIDGFVIRGSDSLEGIATTPLYGSDGKYFIHLEPGESHEQNFSGVGSNLKKLDIQPFMVEDSGKNVFCQSVVIEDIGITPEEHCGNGEINAGEECEGDEDCSIGETCVVCQCVGEPVPVGTPITECGVLGDADTLYVLQNNIPNASGDCFIITADNIVLNGNNKVVTGSLDGYGVIAANRLNITVSDFTIANFTRALNISFVNDSTFENLHIEKNLDNYTSGIYLYKSNSNNINDNTFDGNKVIRSVNSYIHGGIINLERSSNNNLNGNNLQNNQVSTIYRIQGGGIVGLYFGGDNTLVDTTLINNSVTVGGRLYGAGILGMRDSSHNQFTNNIITDNTVSAEQIQGAGIMGGHVSPTGDIGSTFKDSTLTRNNVTTSDYILGGGIVGVRSFSDIRFINTVITGSEVNIGTYLYGGGIMGMKATETGTNIIDINRFNNHFLTNTLNDNYVFVNKSFQGGAIIGIRGCGNSSIKDSMLTGNTAIIGSDAGLIGLYLTNNIIVSNNTACGGAYDFHCTLSTIINGSGNKFGNGNVTVCDGWPVYLDDYDYC